MIRLKHLTPWALWVLRFHAGYPSPVAQPGHQPAKHQGVPDEISETFLRSIAQFQTKELVRQLSLRRKGK